ncbi:hypothetical protein L484_007227 [Morus notabilis]|uniref:Uncharacterized protein n=1 Tax=Morus notabilis TaxID=981085 RepID=W9R492_9ROSA|nr:hypothetical protein L484_007227 [Morus notabilis]
MSSPCFLLLLDRANKGMTASFKTMSQFHSWVPRHLGNDVGYGQLVRLIDSWAGLELAHDKVQESLSRWAEDEAQEEVGLGKTTEVKGRFQKRGSERKQSNEGVPEEGVGDERRARARRPPSWLDGFELEDRR